MPDKITITSPAFKNEELIPIEYTGYGADISPELHLSDIDDRAKSIAVIMNDMGHPIPAFNHWVIWNLPVSKTIEKDIPHGEKLQSLSGAMQGKGYGKNRYRGPKPPFNWSHRYQYNVYVLDCTLDLDGNTKKKKLLKAMDGHILQEGNIVGRYR